MLGAGIKNKWTAIFSASFFSSVNKLGCIGAAVQLVVHQKK